MPQRERNERGRRDLGERACRLPEEHALCRPEESCDRRTPWATERTREAVDANDAERGEARTDHRARGAVPQGLGIRVVHLDRERLERDLVPPDVERATGL